MAVTVFEDVQYESWGGFEDPRLPTRLWTGRVSGTGDGTGGDLSLFIRLNPSTSIRLDSYFSLEEIYLDTDDAIAQQPNFQSRNLGSFKTGLRDVTMRLDNIASEGPTVAMSTGVMNMLPIFLGQQVLTGSLTELLVILDNTTGITMTVWMGGYVWGPRSPSAPNGGLIRPAPGLFRA